VASQDLIYSVLARPLGNQISPVKSQVKEVSETTSLKRLADDEQAVEQYDGNERRKSRRERRKPTNRRNRKQAAPVDPEDEKGSGLDLYA